MESPVNAALNAQPHTGLCDRYRRAAYTSAFRIKHATAFAFALTKAERDPVHAGVSATSAVVPPFVANGSRHPDQAATRGALGGAHGPPQKSRSQ